MSGDEPTDLPIDNPYTAVFRRPNPHTTPELLIETIVSDLAIEGNSFWWQEFEGPTVVSIWRIPPEQVEIIPGTGGGELISSYRWKRMNGESEDYEPHEIMQFKTRHPTSVFRGLGHVARLRESLLLEKEMRNWRYWFFKNGVPATLLLQNASMGNPSDAEMRRLRNRIHSQIVGEGNSGKPLVLSEAWEIKEIPRPTEADVAFIKTMQFTRAEIAMMFGVPPTKLSDYSDAFRANANEQVRDYWFDTVMGWNRIVLGFLNHIWLPAVFPGHNVRFDFDYKNIDAIQANKVEVAEHSAILLANAAITPAEMREAAGYPAADPSTITNAEDMNTLYMNGKKLGEDPLAGLNLFAPRDDDDDGDEEVVDEEIDVDEEEDDDDDEEKRLVWSPTRHLKIPDEVVAAEVERMAEDVSKIIAEIVRASGENQLRLDGVTGSFDLRSPEVLRFISTQSIRVSENIIPTTFEVIREAIARGHDEGLAIGSKRMRALVRAAFDTRKENWQLDRISRTETHQSQEGGGYYAAKQNGIELKMWLTSIDGKERDSHNRINGTTLPLGTAFELESEGKGSGIAKMMYPGDITDSSVGPADVINCRCSWVSIVGDGEGLGEKAFSNEDIWIEKATMAQRYEAVFTKFIKQYYADLQRRVLANLEELRAAA